MIILSSVLLILLVLVFIKRHSLGNLANPLMLSLTALVFIVGLVKIFTSGEAGAKEYLQESQVIAAGVAPRIAELVGSGPVVIVDSSLGQRGPMLLLANELKKNNVEIAGFVRPITDEDVVDPYAALLELTPNRLKAIAEEYPDSVAIISSNRVNYDIKSFPELDNKRFLIFIDQEYTMDLGWLLRMLRNNTARLAVVRNINPDDEPLQLSDPEYFERRFFLMDKNNMWDVGRSMGLID
jgi:hypothetical protein